MFEIFLLPEFWAGIGLTAAVDYLTPTPTAPAKTGPSTLEVVAYGSAAILFVLAVKKVLK